MSDSQIETLSEHRESLATITPECECKFRAGNVSHFMTQEINFLHSLRSRKSTLTVPTRRPEIGPQIGV